MNTRNKFMIAAMAVSLAAVNADAAEANSPSLMPEFDISEIKIDASKLKPEALPSPGIYLSKPYLSIVIVPESVDPAFVLRPGADRKMDNLVIRPYTRLEPYQPSK